MMCSVKKVVFIVPRLAGMPPSGVRTFLLQMQAKFAQRDGWARVVELPPSLGGPTSVSAILKPADGTGSVNSPQVEPVPPERSATSISVALKDVKLGLGYLKDLCRDVQQLWKVRRDWRGSVVVINEFGCETLPIAMRIVAPGSRIVAIGHTHPGHDAYAHHWIRALVERICYWSVTDIIFNSDSTRSEWAKKIGRTAMKGRVIHYGIEAPGQKVNLEYPAKAPGGVDFVCVARFVNWKGHRELIVAWRDAIERATRPMRLILIGDGPALNENRRFCDELGLNDSVLFLGARDNGASYFEAGDVGVLLSNEPEAFGLVLLEAMSRNKPILASRIGGIPEVVEDGVTGILVNPTNASAVASAILRLADSDDLRRSMGDAGLQRWRAHFKVEGMLAAYGEYFSK